MVRPRWQGFKLHHRARAWRRWDQALALLAAANLAWVIFDATYLPLRNFWLQRNLYPLPSVPLAVPLPWLPDITPFYDPIKGIEPHRDTQAYVRHFQNLDKLAVERGTADPEVKRLFQEQARLTTEMITTNPFLNSGNAGALEKIAAIRW